MVPQGMGFDCSAIRHYGRSTDRAIGIAWKAIGWFAAVDRDRSLQNGCLTRAASGARSRFISSAQARDAINTRPRSIPHRSLSRQAAGYHPALILMKLI